MVATTFILPAESEAGADFPQPEKDRAAAPRMARGMQRPKTIFFNMRNSPLYLFNNDPKLFESNYHIRYSSI